MTDQRTLGGWIDPRQRGVITDNLAPGQYPPPSTGQPGPSISVPIAAWEKVMETNDKVGRALAQMQPRYDLVDGFAAAQTDGSGNAFIDVYQVALGLEAQLHRMTINAVNPATGTSYTAASTFSAAAAYIHLHVADAAQTTSIGRGSLQDCFPKQAGGPIFPAVFEDTGASAPFARGPMHFVLHINAGPVATMVYVRYQVSLRRQGGVV